jgi:hypothetical protein
MLLKLGETGGIADAVSIIFKRTVSLAKEKLAHYGLLFINPS